MEFRTIFVGGTLKHQLIAMLSSLAIFCIMLLYCSALLTSMAAAGTTTVDDILHGEICGGPFASALDIHTVRQSGSGSHGPA